MVGTVLFPKIDPAELERIRKSPLFDAEWYTETYPDVAILGMDPAEHYLKFGKSMGRAPGPNAKQAETLAEATPQDDIETFVDLSLKAYRGPRQIPSDYEHSDLPLVSVVMTAFDCKDTIERAVLSLITQSWPRIEVVICDDQSRDGTWEMVRELARRSPDIVRTVRLGTNSGTYLAKNVAIAEARGDIVMFQDSDDYAHPDRVLVSVLPLLADPKLIGTRTQYARFDPDTGRVLKIGDQFARLGLITLAVRRRAFDEIGYFDAVRKAGDDEWFQRLCHLYGRHAVADLRVALYAAELRQGSLVADMLTVRQDGTLDQSSSKERRAYVTTFQARFSDKARNSNWYRATFPAVPRVAAESYPPSVRVLPDKCLPVIGNVCSVPSRVEKLAHVVERILPQVDHLNVYLDKYDRVPQFLSGLENLTVRLSSEFDVDFRDNAKFLAFEDLKRSGKSFQYLTIDDDIVYPFDYVRTLTNRLDSFENRVIVGVHGVVCEEEPTGYFRRRFIYHFQFDALNTPRLVNNLGTGTVCFHSDLFDTLDPRRWPLGGMVDIFLALEARRLRIPMLAIDRHANWIKEFESEQNATTLFGEFGEKEETLLRHLVKGCPWGYRGIIEAINEQPQDLADRLRRLLPAFSGSISVSGSYHRMRGR